jgi:hypothetical protein
MKCYLHTHKHPNRQHTPCHDQCLKKSMLHCDMNKNSYNKCNSSLTSLTEELNVVKKYFRTKDIVLIYNGHLYK